MFLNRGSHSTKMISLSFLLLSSDIKLDFMFGWYMVSRFKRFAKAFWNHFHSWCLCIFYLVSSDHWTENKTFASFISKPNLILIWYKYFSLSINYFVHHHCPIFTNCVFVAVSWWSINTILDLFCRTIPAFAIKLESKIL